MNIVAIKKDIEDFNKIKQSRTKLFSNLNAEEVTFIDVRYIPEFIKDENFKENFGTFFKPEEEGEAYKEKLIQSLIGESGNRAVAEKIYNEVVKEQLNKLYNFEISIEQYTKRLYKQHGVSQVADLPQQDRNNLLAMYYVGSPFTFADSYQREGSNIVTKYYYKDGKQYSSVEPHTMEHITYLPTQNVHFDETFEKEIASDETMYKAWELIDEAVTYNNKNRKYSKRYNQKEFSDSLPFE